MELDLLVFLFTYTFTTLHTDLAYSNTVDNIIFKFGKQIIILANSLARV